MENNEIMVFELIAKSLITELNDFISFNKSKQIITETITKRRNILSLLLKTNDSNLCEIEKNQIDGINTIDDSFIKSISDATINLSKIVVKHIDASEKYITYLKLLKDANQNKSQIDSLPFTQKKLIDPIVDKKCIEIVHNNPWEIIEEYQVNASLQTQVNQQKIIPKKKYPKLVISNLPSNIDHLQLKSLSSDIQNVIIKKEEKITWTADLEFLNEEARRRNYKELQNKKLNKSTILANGANRLLLISTKNLRNVHIYGLSHNIGQNELEKMLSGFNNFKIKVSPNEFASVCFQDHQDSKKAIEVLSKNRKLIVGYAFNHIKLRDKARKDVCRVHIFGIKTNESKNDIRLLTGTCKKEVKKISLKPTAEHAVLHVKNKDLAKNLISKLNGTNYDGRKILVDFEKNYKILVEENEKLINRYCVNIFGIDNRKELEKLLQKFNQIQVEFEQEFSSIYFKNRSDAIKAISDLNGKYVNGNKISVEFSSPFFVEKTNKSRVGDFNYSADLLNGDNSTLIDEYDNASNNKKAKLQI